MKVTNFYCTQELMVMATNLYYHCWFVGGVELQKTHPFPLCLMLLFLFISPPFFFCCSYPPLSQLHTHKDKKKENQIKN
jgi:hypothetical protein